MHLLKRNLNLRSLKPNLFENINYSKSIHHSRPMMGFEEFYDQKKPNEAIIAGRSWTVTDLRRKNFEDLHKLWFVLYKERNLLLSEREKLNRATRPVPSSEEARYIKTKRSMAAIKHVLSERKKLREILNSSDPDLISNPLKGEEKPNFKPYQKYSRGNIPRLYWPKTR